jgi:hypothetical protein
MEFKEVVFENLIGDLDYHPKRAVLYLGLGVAALCVWIFAPSEDKFTAIPLVFGGGSATLLLKGLFLLRKTSAGLILPQKSLGLSQQESVQHSSPVVRNTFPSVQVLSAQIIQDFGTGVVLLGSILHFWNNLKDSWESLPTLPIFLTGGVLFLAGWLIRRATSSTFPLS